MQRLIKDRDFSSEYTITFLRSQGPGGQHVNKVSTQAELTFSIVDSILLTNEEKELLNRNLKSRIRRNGILQIRCQQYRSQLANRRGVIAKFLNLLDKGVKKKKKRIPTKKSKSSQEKRLKSKKKRSEIKAGRMKIQKP